MLKTIIMLALSVMCCWHMRRTLKTRHAVVRDDQAAAVQSTIATYDRMPAPRLQSAIAMIYDEQDQRPIYSKNAEQCRAHCVHHQADDGHGDSGCETADGRTDQHQRGRPRSFEGIAFAHAQRHDACRADELIRLALMASENRAAAALARTYPGGTPVMLAMMNAKARELGMNSTHFFDPTGLNSTNVSTAQDLVKMVMAAQGYPDIQRCTTTGSQIVQVDESPFAAFQQYQSPGEKFAMGDRYQQDRLYQRSRALSGDAGQDHQPSGGDRAAGFLGQAHPCRRCRPHQALDGECGFRQCAACQLPQI